mgnify:CR=1 FL=1
MKKIFLVPLFAMVSFFVTAQEYSWRLTYDVSIPVGELRSDYIEAMSWRGIGIDNRWMIQDKLSVGFAASWHAFYEKKDNTLETTESGDFSAYGNQFRYLNTWIMQANIHYYLGQEGSINPWVGLGIGTAYSVQRMELGFYAYSYKPWSFSLAPQIGVDVPIGMNTDFTIAARYNMLMNAEDNATSDFNYVGINVGFKFYVF